MYSCFLDLFTNRQHTKSMYDLPNKQSFPRVSIQWYVMYMKNKKKFKSFKSEETFIRKKMGHSGIMFHFMFV